MTVIRGVILVGAFTAIACTGEQSGMTDSARDSTTASVAVAECYRADRSVMGRQSPLTGHTSTAPGWIRLDRAAAADSGPALLVDADGAAMDAVWRRGGGDSLAVIAFNDFLRVTLRVTRSDTSLAGNGLATSDAELVRDSAGQLRDLRREWSVSGRAARCDSMPARAQP